jgi:hypothetical protein
MIETNTLKKIVLYKPSTDFKKHMGMETPIYKTYVSTVKIGINYKFELSHEKHCELWFKNLMELKQKNEK